MDNLKVISFLFCSAYLGILSAMWSTKNAQNQFFKVITLGCTIFAAILAFSWNTNGVWFAWYFAFPVVLSAIFGLIFLFAEGANSMFTILFKLMGLISFILAIIYFQS